MAGNDSFYNPTAGKENDNRTYIPGMKRKSTAGQEGGSPSDDGQAVRIELQSRPVAGVLFSISKDNCGELFPIYIGRNTIGNKPDCDVYLSEASVSPDHALILIRKVNLADGTKKVTMTISDSGSENGTFINGEDLDDDIMSIKEGDILRIGKAYNFQFIPLDAESAGLYTSSDFKSTPRVENRPSNHEDYKRYMNAIPADDKIYPNAVGQEDEMTFYGRSTRKKEDHSSRQTL